MQIFVTEGTGVIYLKYSGDATSEILNTSTGLDSYVTHLKTRYMSYFSAGGETGLVDGVTLTGQTSGAIIQVKRVLITNGTIGADDAVGALFFDVITGTITNGENLRVGTTTYCVAESAEIEIPKGMRLRHITLQVETHSLRVGWSPCQITNSAATPASYGMLIQANENMTVVGNINCANFKLINAVADSYGVANLILSY